MSDRQHADHRIPAVSGQLCEARNSGPQRQMPQLQRRLSSDRDFEKYPGIVHRKWLNGINWFNLIWIDLFDKTIMIYEGFKVFFIAPCQRYFSFTKTSI